MKKYYLLTLNENWADEHDVPALKVMDEKEFDKWANTKLSISANLGNGGDDFMEEAQGLTGKQLIAHKYVEKRIVDESFAKTFKKLGLEHLSLCDVFEGEEYQEEDEDY